MGRTKGKGARETWGRQNGRGGGSMERFLLRDQSPEEPSDDRSEIAERIES